MVLDTLTNYLDVADKGAFLAPLSILTSTLIAVSLAIYAAWSNKKECSS